MLVGWIPPDFRSRRNRLGSRVSKTSKKFGTGSSSRLLRVPSNINFCDDRLDMKLFECFSILAIAYTAAMLPMALHAETVTFSNVTFVEFTPNPISLGSHPDSFGYKFSYSKSGNGTVSFNLSIPITLSPNATLGDSDDIQLGTFTNSTTLSGSNGMQTQTAFAFSLTGITVPAATPQGFYNAFLAFGLTGEPGSLPAQFPSKVGVGISLLGDYNSNGVVDAADYVKWRKTDGSAGGYNTWRSNFGNASASATIANGLVPEPNIIAIGVVMLILIWPCKRRRNHHTL
jgi:hypothetical protein